MQFIKRKVGEFQDCLHTHPALFPRELQKLLISAPCGKFPVVHLLSASVYSLCLQASLAPYSCGCGKISKQAFPYAMLKRNASSELEPSQAKIQSQIEHSHAFFYHKQNESSANQSIKQTNKTPLYIILC